jgi:hypothetical protein
MTEPLKWTSKGNVPMSSLRCEPKWKKEGRVLMFQENWFDKETGELVSNDVHGYMLPMSLWERLSAMWRDVKVELKGQEIRSSQGNV